MQLTLVIAAVACFGAGVAMFFISRRALRQEASDSKTQAFKMSRSYGMAPIPTPGELLRFGSILALVFGIFLFVGSFRLIH